MNRQIAKSPFPAFGLAVWKKAQSARAFQTSKTGAAMTTSINPRFAEQRQIGLSGLTRPAFSLSSITKPLNVGRVQTPTLTMLVNRDYAISSFKKEKYHVVRLDVGGVAALSERQDDEAAARAYESGLREIAGRLYFPQKEKKTVAPPKLFDLTALQREANRLYGFTAKQTLDYAQALYEKRLFDLSPHRQQIYHFRYAGQHKGTHYRALFAASFMRDVKLQADLARICDNSKVTDHHAILPTAEFVKNGLFFPLPKARKS